MPHLSIRIDFDHEGRLGPGKVMLLERIAREGMQEAFGQILVPTEEVVEMKSGQKNISLP